MSGAETLTPERVDQRSFTRCMVLDALVERGVASASLAKPRRSVLQLKTMLKDLLAGGGDAPMVPASARADAAAQQLVGATSGTGMTLSNCAQTAGLAGAPWVGFSDLEMPRDLALGIMPSPIV